MPTKAAVHLHFPTHDKEVVVKKTLDLDGQGRFRHDAAAVDVPLMPGMNHHAGGVQLGKDTMKLLARDLKDTRADTSEIIHIDMDAGGVQIKYAGLDKGWVGIPGAYTYKAETGKDSQELYEGRRPQEKHTVFVVMMILVVCAFAAVLIAMGIAVG